MLTVLERNRGICQGLLVFVLLLCVSSLLGRAAAQTAIPNFAPDPNTSWIPDRPTGDEFIPWPSGPGPVQSPADHPYVPNGQGRQTYRIADVTNPILMPWVADRLKTHNDDVRAGKVPFNAK